jgi:hypothetical protein
MLWFVRLQISFIFIVISWKRELNQVYTFKMLKNCIFRRQQRAILILTGHTEATIVPAVAVVV